MGGDAVQVRGNWLSLLARRSLLRAEDASDRSLGRLASGLRVNSARDDAAGLAISQGMLRQISGLNMANRNALDGISLVNTAEGALVEIHDILQRGRELAIRAANTILTDADKQLGQTEVGHLLAEIDRISESTNFNGLRILTTSGAGSAMADMVTGLRSGWLEQAEQLINTHYGLLGDGSMLQIAFDQSGSSSTWVTGTAGINGRLDDLTLHINLADFALGGGADGGSGPVYNDRKIAYALTQAIMARSLDYVSLDDWFKSGVSDYIAGADEALLTDVGTYGLANVINAISSWSNDSLHRSAAYLAIKYLDSMLNPLTMTDVMTDLQNNDLNTALLNTLGMDTATFINDFKANGAAFYGTLNLADADVGGIGGGDASSVIPNGGTYSNNPLTSLTIEWPSSGAGANSTFQLQVGANSSEAIDVVIPEITRWSLGMVGVNIATRADEAINSFDRAINTVSTVRSYLGTIVNRLEHIVSGNAYKSELQSSSVSRIRDVDHAKETTSMIREQLLFSSSTAMLSQANTARQHVMWLLKDLSSPSGFVPRMRISF